MFELMFELATVMKSKLCDTVHVTAQNFRIKRIIFLMMNEVEIANAKETVTPIQSCCGVKLAEQG